MDRAVLPVGGLVKRRRGRAPASRHYLIQKPLGFPSRGRAEQLLQIHFTTSYHSADLMPKDTDLILHHVVFMKSGSKSLYITNSK